MTCDQAIERLPWLLNRTLEVEEERQVREHLAECPECRKALAETGQAWQLFDPHPPAADLVARAFGDGVADPELDRHLSNCPQCAADLELARLSRQLEADDKILPMSPRNREASPSGGRIRLYLGSALAAGLAGLIAAGGWIESAHRIDTLEAKLAQGVLTDTWSGDVSPASDIERGAGSNQEVVLPAGHEAYTLSLNAERHAEQFPAYEADVLDSASRRKLQTLTGLTYDKTEERYGGLTFRRENLPAGRYRLQLFGVGAGGVRVPLEEFRFRVGVADQKLM
jgi:anti-sigma factor RsiW